MKSNTMKASELDNVRDKLWRHTRTVKGGSYDYSTLTAAQKAAHLRLGWNPTTNQWT